MGLNCTHISATGEERGACQGVKVRSALKLDLWKMILLGAPRWRLRPRRCFRRSFIALENPTVRLRPELHFIWFLCFRLFFFKDQGKNESSCVWPCFKIKIH